MKKKHSFIRIASPLFLAIFIDGMGLGLLFPLLNALFVSSQSGFISHPYPIQTRQLLFGLTISLFMLCWFFGAAYLGDLSDAIGRKKSLVICLVGSAIGYGLTALAVDIHSIILLLFGRIIAGFTGGSQAIAQAAIVDISDPAFKTRNIGLILLFASLGFVFGPLCGAFFSNNHIVSWFTIQTPLYFATLISLFNALLLLILFSETFVTQRSLHWQLHRAIDIFISAFKHNKVRYLSIILLLMIAGWSSYYSFISLYLSRQYHFNTAQIDLFLALMAGGFGVGFGCIVNFLAHRFSMKYSIICALFISALLVGITAGASHQSWIACMLAAPIGISVAIAYSMLLTLFSNQVDETMQGWIMGITVSIMAMCFAITGITSALLANWNVASPIWFAAILFGCSMLAMFNLKTSS